MFPVIVVVLVLVAVERVGVRRWRTNTLNAFS